MNYLLNLVRLKLVFFILNFRGYLLKFVYLLMIGIEFLGLLVRFMCQYLYMNLILTFIYLAL